VSRVKRRDREMGSPGEDARHRWLALGGRGAGPNQPRGTCKPPGRQFRYLICVNLRPPLSTDLPVTFR
jgi:hypothetical protein